VTRLEQQLTFARENETRLTEQVAQLTEAVGALTVQQAALDSEQETAERGLEDALTASERTAADEAQAQTGLPALESAVADAVRQFSDASQQIAQTEQGLRVAETRRDSAAQALARITERRERLATDFSNVAAPETDPAVAVQEQLDQETADLAERQHCRRSCRARCNRCRIGSESANARQETSKRLADLAARADALSALQAKIGHGKDVEGGSMRGD
jgi:chromosome segregation ATPase